MKCFFPAKIIWRGEIFSRSPIHRNTPCNGLYYLSDKLAWLVLYESNIMANNMKCEILHAL